MSTKLLNAATENGDGSTTYTFIGDGMQRTIEIYGTWDGATVSIRSNNTSKEIMDGSFTSYAGKNIVGGPGFVIKANLSGVGATTSLTVEIF